MIQWNDGLVEQIANAIRLYAEDNGIDLNSTRLYLTGCDKVIFPIFGSEEMTMGEVVLKPTIYGIDMGFDSERRLLCYRVLNEQA